MIIRLFVESLGPNTFGTRGRRSIRERRRFVTAGQDRVVQIGRVGFSGIKGYDNSLTLCIYPDVAHSRDAHERFAQFADAFVAIFAFRRDRDSLQHRFVGALQIMRVGWIEMVRIEWFDHRFNLRAGTRRASPCLKVIIAAKPPPQRRFDWARTLSCHSERSRGISDFLEKNSKRCLGPSRTGVFTRHDKEADRVRGSSHRRLFERGLPRDRFKHAPDIFHQNFMSGGVRMNAIG